MHFKNYEWHECGQDLLAKNEVDTKALETSNVKEKVRENVRIILISKQK
jgi:hypothetical protein